MLRGNLLSSRAKSENLQLGWPNAGAWAIAYFKAFIPLQLLSFVQWVCLGRLLRHREIGQCGKN